MTLQRIAFSWRTAKTGRSERSTRHPGRCSTRFPYGDDADNLRRDPSSSHIWVGYGGGALGEFDQEGTKVANIKLDAHPESFQLEKNGSRIFVNLPQSRKIAVVDRKKGTVTEYWGTGGPLANYPMALDEQNHRLFVSNPISRAPHRARHGQR